MVDSNNSRCQIFEYETILLYLAQEPVVGCTDEARKVIRQTVTK